MLIKKRDLKTIFLQLDRDGSGTIEAEEIVTFLLK
jgi:Ca2+-binding EF-hand superfamily protein